MPYEPPPTWLPDKEILAHICAADSCTPGEAAANLELAIRHNRLPTWPWPPSLDVGHPLSFYLPAGPGSTNVMTPDWKGLLLPQAQVKEDGELNFGPQTPWQNFKAKRADVERIWPPKPMQQKIANEHGEVVQLTDAQPDKLAAEASTGQDGASRRLKRHPIMDGILDALAAIPGVHALEPKQRDEKIRVWLEQNDRKVPAGSGLPRAVQRALAIKPKP